MSYGVLKGALGPNRYVRARTKLPVSSLETASNLVVAGNNFQIQDSGVHFIDLLLNISSYQGNTPYTIELYDETDTVVVQSYQAVAYPQAAQDQWFGFNWNVTDPTHQYSFYLTPDADNYSRTANYGLLLTDLNLRAEVKSAASGGTNDAYLLAVATLGMG